MENPNPDRGPGRFDPNKPGQDDQGDVGTDPRRTRDPEQDGDNQKRQMPGKDQRQDDTPKAG